MTLIRPTYLWRFIKTKVKKLLPKGLFRRSLLIIFTPLICVQFVLSYIFFDRHTQTILTVLSQTIAGDVAWVVERVGSNTQPIETIQKQAHTYMSLDVQVKPKITPQHREWHKSSWLYQFLGQALDEKMKSPYFLRIGKDLIFIQVDAGPYLVEITTLRKRLFSRTTPLVMIWTIVSSIILFFVASIFMRNQIRPLHRLAAAAERFGQGDDSYPIKIEGANEVRQLGEALNLMRQRLQRHLSERTEMLACVSHDLRTILTRLRLQVTILPFDMVQEMEKDIIDMQHMLEGFLLYARSGQDETKSRVHVLSLIQEIWEKLPKPSTMEGNFLIDQKLVVTVKRQIFSRCLGNIFANSIKYATQVIVHGHMTCQNGQDLSQLILTIDDNGPGIDPQNWDNVFKPFYRGDQARQIHAGSVGLGLTIVRDGVRAHGGQISLGISPQGGLRVQLSFPC